MIAELTSSKLGRFLVLGVPLLILAYWIGDTNVNMHSSIPVEKLCIGVAQTSDYCNFTCSFSTPINTTGRVFVTHTSWASIYEHRMNLTENQTTIIYIQLPRRTYYFYLRAVFWSSKPGEAHKYGTAEEWLHC
jgi:hypothetical protein